MEGLPVVKIFLYRREAQRKFNAKNSAPFAKRFAFFSVTLSSHLTCDTSKIKSLPNNGRLI